MAAAVGYGRRVESRPGHLYAISDLHVRYAENREFVTGLRPSSDRDWLIVAGDVAETEELVAWTLELLAGRFHTVLWVPGNHELWSRPDRDPLRGEARYRRLVDLARGLGVVTPEDPYPVWHGPGGPVVVAPLFLLYDYTFLPPGATTQAEAMALARQSGVICTDELLLHPDPYPSREAWCHARVAQTAARLDEVPPELPTVLINHWPLVQEPTRVLRYPEFAQWCGTVRTADWHTRFRAAAVVYGHLHIPRTTWYDGVRFEEVSLGYPREWRPRPAAPKLRRILPADD
ncbi:metallophosphoesterase family protein [Micromonospora sonchi]|uniref:metallophosphoesterase family protein n=1 Tax=Micromonospora sonchi TaxID=1763543 RepID=UPI0035716D9F